MNVFLKKIGLFSSIVVCLLIIGELVCRNISTSYSVKDEFLKQNGARINTLILGSSHTYYGIVPSLLNDSCFNLANISQTPEYDFRLLEHYYPFCPNLNRVIIPISYFTFSDLELEKTQEWRLCINYKIANHLDCHSNFSKYNFEITSFQTFTAKLLSLLLKYESNYCDSLGFGLGYEIENRPDNWMDLAQQRVEHLTAYRPERQEEVINCINKTINFCKERDINVVLVTTPVWISFKHLMNHAQYSRMISCASDIAHEQNIPYYNLFDCNLFEEEDFHDVDHLSNRGAIKFSLILNSLIQSDSTRITN